MRKFGILLIVTGLTIVAWFGYERWEAAQSVHDLNGDVVKASKINESSGKHQTDNKQKHDPPDFRKGDAVAKLVIPKLNKAYDTFWGTDEETLTGGVGMYVSDLTTPPGQGGHTVLSGHRDTVFRPVGELEDGDSLYVSYQGVDYQYKINNTWITDADDRSVIIEKDEPTLTLTTCYPFEYIGAAPDRYIIQAELVDQGDLLMNIQ